MDGGLGTMPLDRSTPRTGALRADYARYLHVARAHHRGWRAHAEAVVQFGFLAIAVYRFGRWARTLPRLASWPFKLAYRLLEAGVRILFGIEISADSDIGPGLYIGHAFCIVVHGRLGAHCALGQGVTIGSKGAGKSNGFPRLGDNVYLGAGAMVIGAVEIGDDVVVGANTVVVQDVPAGSRVVSAPVRILPRRDAIHGGNIA